MTLHKSYSAHFKAAKDSDGNPTGEVTAVVSVFGNVDIVGDRVVKGAFAKSLERWKEAGDPIPMIWSHDWSNPMSHIGEWDPAKAQETDEGLELTGMVDLESDNPIAKQAFRLMSTRRVREFSFAYDVLDEAKASDGANELLDLELLEAGPTLKGANPETRLLAAKAEQEALLKAGRVLSSKNESALRDAMGLIKGVLDSLGKPESDDDGKQDEPEAKAGPEDDAKAEAQASDDGMPEPAVTEPEPVVAPKSDDSDDLKSLTSYFDDVENVLVLGLEQHNDE